MEKLYLLSADIYRQAYLQMLSADIIIGRSLCQGTTYEQCEVVFITHTELAANQAEAVSQAKLIPGPNYDQTRW